MSAFSVKTDVKGILDLRRKFAPGGVMQVRVDEAVVRFSTPYVPFQSGVLADSPVRATQYGSGVVVWPGPYAHYMYYGEVYGPNYPVFEDDTGEPTRWWSPPGKTKVPTGRPLKYSTEGHALAGPFWVDRMKAERMGDLLKEVADGL